MVMAKATAEIQVDVTSKETIDISFTAFYFNVALFPFFFSVFFFFKLSF